MTSSGIRGTDVSPGGNGSATEREPRGSWPAVSRRRCAPSARSNLEHVRHKRLPFAWGQEPDELVPLFARQHVKVRAWRLRYHPSF